MKIGSLFSGIGGLELGLECAGLGRTIWQVELSEWCRARLAKHWPDAERFVDVCSVSARTLAPVDLLCGGFPCQDVSAAGRKAGLTGARSGLWRQFRRLTEELRPRWCVIENVTSGAGLWVDAVREDLGKLGYASLPINLEARWFGAPHVRSRIFIIAHAHGFPLWLLEQWQPRRWADRIRDEGKAGFGRFGWWETQPRMGYLGDGLSTFLDADHRRGLGNAVMPQMAQIVGTVIAQLDRAMQV